MMKMRDILIERMKATMEKLDISAAELSRRTGIRSSSISDYLTGKYAPKQDKIDLIAEALGVSPVWLMGWDDENGLKNAMRVFDATPEPDETENNAKNEELPVLDDPEIRALARKDNFKSNPEKAKKLKQLIKIMLENDGDD